jgi:hypothetical protein
MNNNQTAFKNMYDVTFNLLNLNIEIYQHILPLKTAIDKAAEKHAMISGLVLKQQKVNSGIAENKNNMIEATGKTAYMICGMLIAYSNATNDVTLKNQANYSKTKLTLDADNDCIIRQRLVLNLAEANATVLEPYGLTPDLLATYKTKVESTEASMSLPRQASTESSTATKTLDVLFSEMNTIFRETIDKLILQFEDSHPEFYTAYIKARMVINLGGRSSKGDSDTPTE